VARGIATRRTRPFLASPGAGQFLYDLTIESDRGGRCLSSIRGSISHTVCTRQDLLCSEPAGVLGIFVVHILIRSGELKPATVPESMGHSVLHTENQSEAWLLIRIFSSLSPEFAPSFAHLMVAYRHIHAHGSHRGEAQDRHGTLRFPRLRFEPPPAPPKLLDFSS
jgi:hypothetical protein